MTRETGLTSFDILGRVTGHKQTTDGQQYTTGYSYNLAGALIEETYPSGRVVKNVLDNTGDLSIVQSKKNSTAGYWNYADAFTYNAAGAVTAMQLGNGRWESTTFNSRLQPTQIALGTTPGTTDKLKLEYGYHEPMVADGVNAAILLYSIHSSGFLVDRMLHRSKLLDRMQFLCYVMRTVQRMARFDIQAS